MNNRFLRLFLLFFLTGSSSLVLLSCSTLPIEEKDDVTDQQRDLERFNKIDEDFRKKLSKELSAEIKRDYEIKDGRNKELKNALDKGSGLTDDKTSDLLDNNDDAVQFFQTKFEDAFKKVNDEIRKNNSNIYAKRLPSRFLSSQTKGVVNLVKVAVLQELASVNNEGNLKITRLNFKFSYELYFKQLSPRKNSYDLEVLLTNDLKIKGDIQKNLSKKINDLIYPELEKFKVIDDSFMKADNENIYNKYVINSLCERGQITYYIDKLSQIIKSKLKTDFNANINYKVDLDKGIENWQGSSSSLYIPGIKFYDNLYPKPSTSVEDMKPKIFDAIKDKIRFQYNKDSNFERYKTSLSLSSISIEGLSLVEVVKNPSNQEELKITFSVSNKLLTKHLDIIIDWLANFLHYYEFNVVNGEAFISISRDLHSKIFKNKSSALKGQDLVTYFDTTDFGKTSSLKGKVFLSRFFSWMWYNCYNQWWTTENIYKINLKIK